LHINIVGNGTTAEGSADTARERKHINKLESKIGELVASNATLSKSLKASQCVEAQMEEALSALRTKFNLKIQRTEKQKAEEIEAAMSHSDDKVRDLLRQIEDLKRNVGDLQEKEARLSATAKKLKGQLHSKTDLTKQQSRENKQLQDELDKHKLKLGEFESNLSESKSLSQERDLLCKESDRLKKALDDLHATIQKQEQEHLQELQMAEEKAQSEVHEAVSMLRQLEIRASDAEKRADASRRELDQTRQMQEQRSEKIIDDFVRLMRSDDRTVWATPFKAAVEDIERNAESFAKQQAKEECDEMRSKMGDMARQLQEMKVQVEEASSARNSEEPIVDDDDDQKEVLQAELTALQEDVQQKASLIIDQETQIRDLSLRLDGRERENADESLQWQNRLKEVNDELKAFRSKARSMMEAKDKELMASKAMLSLQQLPTPPVPAPTESENAIATIPVVGEQPVGVDGTTASPNLKKLREEIEEKDSLINSLQNALEDSERTHTLRDQSEKVLKQEIYDMQRTEKRGKVDLTYVKNVLLKGFESGSLPPDSSMLGVLSRLLEFSPQELERIPKQKKLFQM